MGLGPFQEIEPSAESLRCQRGPFRCGDKRAAEGVRGATLFRNAVVCGCDAGDPSDNVLWLLRAERLYAAARCRTRLLPRKRIGGGLGKEEGEWLASHLPERVVDALLGSREGVLCCRRHRLDGLDDPLDLTP